eukprot:NODE_161_length_2468_cov_184.250748_g157_i0.p1 GENE.NODE_161_length_2468_cov_184.250748_g157_i0~~NODE_161_length_2468_cov_184.250748_g157_i0.p1  ORF type:complete len:745 (+),score=173.46 NODE_161_length_2468_cov_184.250748_g157_i0:73-2307(+)
MAEERKDPAKDFDHIKIAVRCRPLDQEEQSRVQVIIKADGDKLIAFYPESKEGLLYNYDYFFAEDTSQLDVFTVVGAEMVNLCMEGYNACCLGYGPSAAGKTHTLFGSDQEQGLIQMTTKELFSKIEAEPDNISYDVSFTYWEMNNDEIRDALNPQNTKNMPVRKNTKWGGVYIPGLTEVTVTSWDELDDWVMKGNITRIHLSEARMARWHGFLKLKLTRRDSLNPDTVRTSTMLFGHLKGPDRVGQKGAVGDVLKHGASVNKSITLLSAAMLHVVDMRRRRLNDVLTDENLDETQTQAKLAETQTQLAKDSESLFAECKLTQVLQEALGGQAGTILLANVSTTDYHETTDTLENLQNAQQITVQLKQHIHTTAAGRVHKQLQEARAQLPAAEVAPGHPLTELEERVQKLEEKYAHLVEGSERPETPPSERPEPPPMALPQGPKWKQSNAKAGKHGNRATVYIPTKGGKNTYKGQWENSLKSGHGEQVTDLSKYVGEWRNGMRDGEGVLWTRARKVDPWDRVYKGGWHQDKRHGYGTNWYPNGDIYEGYWQYGKRSGVGKLFMANGDKIEGQWKNDRTEGWATLYLSNGDWFEGHWHNGLKEGPGMWCYERKQQTYTGQWHLNVAKCGVLEDMETKIDNQNSHFIPRCGLTDPDGVLTQTQDRLGLQRDNISHAIGEEPLDYTLGEESEEEEEEDPGEVPEEDMTSQPGDEDIDEMIDSDAYASSPNKAPPTHPHAAASGRAAP